MEDEGAANWSRSVTDRLATTEVKTFLLVYIPLKLVIVVGNLLTVVTVVVNKSRHTTPYVYTASLAMADLLIGLTVMYDVALLTAPSAQPVLTCPVNLMMCAALAQSSLTTTLIALDRTLAIVYPLKYPLWMTPVRTAAVICLTVVLSVMYASLALQQAGWSAETCDIWTAVGTHRHLLSQVSPVAVSLLVTGALYSYILIIAYRHRAAIAKLHRGVSGAALWAPPHPSPVVSLGLRLRREGGGVLSASSPQLPVYCSASSRLDASSHRSLDDGCGGDRADVALGLCRADGAAWSASPQTPRYIAPSRNDSSSHLSPHDRSLGLRRGENGAALSASAPESPRYSVSSRYDASSHRSPHDGSLSFLREDGAVLLASPQPPTHSASSRYDALSHRSTHDGSVLAASPQPRCSASSHRSPHDGSLGLRRADGAALSASPQLPTHSASSRHDASADLRPGDRTALSLPQPRYSASSPRSRYDASATLRHGVMSASPQPTISASSRYDASAELRPDDRTTLASPKPGHSASSPCDASAGLRQGDRMSSPYPRPRHTASVLSRNAPLRRVSCTSYHVHNTAVSLEPLARLRQAELKRASPHRRLTCSRRQQRSKCRPSRSSRPAAGGASSLYRVVSLRPASKSAPRQPPLARLRELALEQHLADESSPRSSSTSGWQLGGAFVRLSPPTSSGQAARRAPSRKVSNTSDVIENESPTSSWQAARASSRKQSSASDVIENESPPQKEQSEPEATSEPKQIPSPECQSMQQVPSQQNPVGSPRNVRHRFFSLASALRSLVSRTTSFRVKPVERCSSMFANRCAVGPHEEKGSYTGNIASGSGELDPGAVAGDSPRPAGAPPVIFMSLMGVRMNGRVAGRLDGSGDERQRGEHVCTGEGQPPAVIPRGEHVSIGEGQPPPVIPRGEHVSIGEGQPPPVIPRGEHVSISEGQPIAVIPRENVSIGDEQTTEVIPRGEHVSIGEGQPLAVIPRREHVFISEGQPTAVIPRGEHVFIGEGQPPAVIPRGEHVFISEGQPPAVIPRREHVSIRGQPPAVIPQGEGCGPLETTACGSCPASPILVRGQIHTVATVSDIAAQMGSAASLEDALTGAEQENTTEHRLEQNPAVSSPAGYGSLIAETCEHSQALGRPSVQRSFPETPAPDEPRMNIRRIASAPSLADETTQPTRKERSRLHPDDTVTSTPVLPHRDPRTSIIHVRSMPYIPELATNRTHSDVDTHSVEGLEYIADDTVARLSTYTTERNGGTEDDYHEAKEAGSRHEKIYAKIHDSEYYTPADRQGRDDLAQSIPFKFHSRTRLKGISPLSAQQTTHLSFRVIETTARMSLDYTTPTMAGITKSKTVNNSKYSPMFASMSEIPPALPYPNALNANTSLARVTSNISIITHSKDVNDSKASTALESMSPKQPTLQFPNGSNVNPRSESLSQIQPTLQVPNSYCVNNSLESLSPTPKPTLRLAAKDSNANTRSASMSQTPTTVRLARDSNANTRSASMSLTPTTIRLARDSNANTRSASMSQIPPPTLRFAMTTSASASHVVNLRPHSPPAFPLNRNASSDNSLTAIVTPRGFLSSGLWKSFRMFFFVWGIYFLTMTPVILSSWIFVGCNLSQRKSDFIVKIDSLFIYINSGVNVFIYAWKDKRLRKSLALVLRCRWRDI